MEDEGLVAENAGLTEWPVPLLGRFDAAYLGLPPEVIQLTARVNQKYFVCRGKDGKIATVLVCTDNISSTARGGRNVDGNHTATGRAPWRKRVCKYVYNTGVAV